MTGNINELSRYSKRDIEKSRLVTYTLEGYYGPRVLKESLKNIPDKAREFQKLNFTRCYDEKFELSGVDVYDEEISDEEIIFVESKYCPECGRKYPKSENVCFECLIHLKDISDDVDVFDIEFSPQFIIEGENDFDSFEDLLNKTNLSKINEFDFSIRDFSKIIYRIKSQAFKNFDNLVKTNEIDFDSLDILDKIILFTKSFVNVNYKSFGGQLGYFETGTIFIDDRQTKSLQITTLIHELSHFIIQEILIHIICKILNASRNLFIESLTSFILSYSSFTQLIDEYSAHSVEGRFTIFGYQDYSSYKQIEKSLQGEMSTSEIEITKSIGNTFAIYIKKILESLIDKDLREEIKEQFLSDVLDDPDFNALRMENCQKLNNEGFIKAIWLILNEGCEVASSHIDELVVKYT
ncbi:hypothetical protein [Methanobrevibacter sp.]|uniref:hypothetical protein n=1 Tax=Methanobrevibacter sp. TaxID=66852 RepID=UPI002600BA22|nr:hypothetical protein [Methanobrevibacter sp.]MBR4448502.1 hypothetical protein [Methanobrevibacter sp.]